MTRTKITHLFCLLSLLLIAPISHGKASENIVFQSWSVICGDDNYCTATTEDQSNAAGVMTVRRSNDRTANWEISVQTKADNPSQFGLLSMRFAGQRLHRLQAKRDYATFTKANEFFLINTRALDLLFRRMIESRRVFFAFGAKNQQKINASYSLNGLSSALLWIDEQQNRIGSRRRAEPPIERVTKEIPRPASAPRPSSSPSPITLDAESLATKLHRKTLDPSLCDIPAEQIYSIGVTVEALDEATSLVMIPCFAADYNTSFRIFLVNQENQTASLQLWATYSAYTGWVGTDILSNVSYDNQNKELTMVHKGRDLGDCGISGTWSWINEGREEQAGGRFEMKEFAAKDTCDGKDSDWPVIFSSAK